MSAAGVASWDDAREAALGLVSEAYGWGRGIDHTDDAAVLAWARVYLPRVIEQGQARDAIAARHIGGGAA